MLLMSDKVRIAAEDRQERRSDRFGVLLNSWRVGDGDEVKGAGEGKGMEITEGSFRY